MEQLRFGDRPREEPAAPPEFMTIEEAARRVRCCERTIRRAIETGALRAGRVRASRSGRGGFRIRPEDLDDWMYGDE